MDVTLGIPETENIRVREDCLQLPWPCPEYRREDSEPSHKMDYT